MVDHNTVAAIGTVLGAIVVKIVEKYNNSHDDDGKLETLQKQVDDWRLKYWTEIEENVSREHKIRALEQQLKDITENHND